MLDITNYKNEIGDYGGSEVKKTYYIEGVKYMVKFPDPVREKNKKISYVNNQYSEYIGCKIFKLFGIDTQEVLLVKCLVDNSVKIAVACKDFLACNTKLIEFKTLSYTLNVNKKYTSNIDDIYEMINLVPTIDSKEKVITDFWRRFVIDTLLGNSDRHLGNLAFIENDNKYVLSPIYDCGSCLNPLLSVRDMEALLNDKRELKNIAYNVKTAFRINDIKASYIDIYNKNIKELINATIEIVPKIDMKLIHDIIYSIDTITDIQKDFYYQTILLRKEYILDKYYLKYTSNNSF